MVINQSIFLMRAFFLSAPESFHLNNQFFLCFVDLHFSLNGSKEAASGSVGSAEATSIKNTSEYKQAIAFINAT